MCEHKPTGDRRKYSLAHMWRKVYKPDLPVWVKGDDLPLPEERIGPKECACCFNTEFTEVDDYICLWCRFYELVDTAR